MARVTPLWRSDEISVHRFDHPVEHEDQAYEEVADSFRASFVEEGTFDLHIGEGRWRVNAGDVMLSHPGMHFRTGFQGAGFNDTCLSLTYLAANDDRFDKGQAWAKRERPVVVASNRVRYLRWGLARAVEHGAPMLAEYCATEIFSEPPRAGGDLFSEHKFGWYAERVEAVRERIDRDFAEEFTVSELARGVGMSMFNFTRVFSELTGLPPHRYVLKARLNAARRMLRDGRSVTETCFACGFNNLSHFSRSFARRFGRAPSHLLGQV
jgi:AraC-like DNA-binding protein